MSPRRPLLGFRASRGSRAIGSGWEFAFGVLGLTLAGYWLDGFLDSSPWAVLIGATLGIVGGTYNLIRDALASNSPAPSSDDDAATGGDEPGEPTESPRDP